MPVAMSVIAGDGTRHERQSSLEVMPSDKERSRDDAYQDEEDCAAVRGLEAGKELGPVARRCVDRTHTIGRPSTLTAADRKSIPSERPEDFQ